MTGPTARPLRLDDPEPTAPARLVAHVHPATGSWEALVRRRGFAAERYYAVMWCPLTDLPHPPVRR
jgi:mycothiol synthase